MGLEWGLELGFVLVGSGCLGVILGVCMCKCLCMCVCIFVYFFFGVRMKIVLYLR